MSSRTTKTALASGLGLGLWLLPAVSLAGLSEPNTGVSFNKQRSWGQYRQIAVGLAMKKKMFFKVYAACLYIDKARGKQSLLKLAKASKAYNNGRLDQRKLLKKNKLYDWLISSDLAVTIDLTFVRSFDYQRFRKNYGEKLSAYLKDRALIDRFLRLPSGDIKEFGHLTFNLLPGGKVVLQYMGKTFKPIRSRPLRRAVLGTFFGKHTDSQGDRIRRGLVKHIDQLLR